MNKSKVRGLFGVVLLLGTLAWAGEFRTWSDKKGNTIQAEFVRLFGDKVMLKTKDGKELSVPVGGLSLADQEYLAKMVPPEMEITVDKDLDTERTMEVSGYTQREETATLNITIKKKGKNPSTGTYKAVVYMLINVVGEEYGANYRRVGAYNEHIFSFKEETVDEKDAEAEKQTKPKKTDETSFSLSNVTTVDDWREKKEGWQYEGYILVILDEKGKVVNSVVSTDTYESFISFIDDFKDGKKNLPLSRNLWMLEEGAE
ncbi:MAG: hypothetical protein JXR40_12355 [Pontiellaceae bacterium]|nr:hypothetical protein [Pontiellaceae bacterium]